MWKKVLTALSLPVFTFATAGLPAAEKIDLNRTTPVPAGEQIPIADFFRPRLLQQPSLNPSGTQIAALISSGSDQYQLLVYDVNTAKIETLSAAGDKDIDAFAWLNDERLIFSFSSRKLYGLGLLCANVGRLDRPYPVLQYYGARLVAIPPANRLRPLIWASYDSLETQRELGVVEVNTDLQFGRVINLATTDATGTETQDAKESNERHITRRFPLPQGGGLGTSYIADKEGRLEFGLTASDGLFTLHRLVDGGWQKCPVDLESIEVVDAGNKSGDAVIVGPRNTGKPRPLQLLDAASGQLGEVLLQDKGYDFDGWLYHDPVTHEIVGAVYDRAGPQAVWFNDDYRSLQKILDGFFPGVVTRIIGNDEKGKLTLVATFSDRQPPIYHWVDLASRKVGFFKNSAPWIDPARMQPMNIMKYKTRDGRTLDAYVTMPAGASKKNPPPLVVLSHGGPWARDRWGFNGEVQFLASRGYAVLQANYRGSTGYDWMFPYEDRFAFRKMSDDVTDATKQIIASGLVDSHRVAIMGASFGAYLALSGVAYEPDLYRCAVVNAGVFDWEEVINDRKHDKYDNPQFSYLIRHLGDPGKEKEKFDAISPGRHVDKVRVPVFVAHGKDDPVAPPAESRRLVAELQKHNIPYESFFKGGEGHGMAHLDSEVELYTRIEAFLAKNLAPAARSP